MKKPSRFGAVFVFTMVVVAILYAIVGVTCVYAFGNVTSGSLTAFLLENFGNDNAQITAWVNVANTAVSFSVLLTFPLTMFPAIELLGIAVENSNSLLAKLLRGGMETTSNDDDSLEAFEPLPSLPEDDVASIDSFPIEHLYGQEDLQSNNQEEQAASTSGMSLASRWFSKTTLPGDSLQLRSLLVLSTYIIAVVVPNVQSLISLAGAVAGSSTALLIPPLLELAWIEHLEHCELQLKSNLSSSVPASPHDIRMSMGKRKSKRRKGRWTSGNYWKDKVKCYILLLFGAIFMAVGTFASISDIIKIYMGKG